MAGARYIQTKFWKDDYIVNLDPTEKLLYIYMITGPQTNLAGIYELTVREMAFDTGIDCSMVLKILNRFQSDGKIHYCNPWLIVVNAIKNTLLYNKSPKLVSGIMNILELVPQHIKTLESYQKATSGLIGYQYGMDRVSIPLDIMNQNQNQNLIKKNQSKDCNNDAKKQTTDDSFKKDDLIDLMFKKFPSKFGSRAILEEAINRILARAVSKPKNAITYLQKALTDFDMDKEKLIDTNREAARINCKQIMNKLGV